MITNGIFLNTKLMISSLCWHYVHYKAVLFLDENFPLTHTYVHICERSELCSFLETKPYKVTRKHRLTFFLLHWLSESNCQQCLVVCTPNSNCSIAFICSNASSSGHNHVLSPRILIRTEATEEDYTRKAAAGRRDIVLTQLSPTAAAARVPYKIKQEVPRDRPPRTQKKCYKIVEFQQQVCSPHDSG